MYTIISECDKPYLSLPISEHHTTMSSTFGADFGPENLFDDNASTIAHTSNHPNNHKITILLSTPQTITSVILMNRGDNSHLPLLERLNNTTVTLVNPDQNEFDCGFVQLQSVALAEVVTVTCDSLEFLAKQIVISKLTTERDQSLNIAELRVCYLPQLRTYKSSIYFTKSISDKKIVKETKNWKLADDAKTKSLRKTKSFILIYNYTENNMNEK